MEGFILAAGLGTRLKPLTNDRPKALVTVGGKTLLELTINRLRSHGTHRIVVNVHHFGQQVIDFLNSRDWGCEIVISDERPMLMDTGGALRQAASLFTPGEPILVHNVDILSDVNLDEVLKIHLQGQHLVTLCASHRNTQRLLVFDAEGQLRGRREEVALRDDDKTLAFSGISIVSPELFPLLPEATIPYPIIPCYIKLARNHKIRCFEHPAEHWLDVGKPETLQTAQQWTIHSYNK